MTSQRGLSLFILTAFIYLSEYLVLFFFSSVNFDIFMKKLV